MTQADHWDIPYHVMASSVYKLWGKLTPLLGQLEQASVSRYHLQHLYCASFALYTQIHVSLLLFFFQLLYHQNAFISTSEFYFLCPSLQFSPHSTESEQASEWCFVTYQFKPRQLLSMYSIDTVTFLPY